MRKFENFCKALKNLELAAELENYSPRQIKTKIFAGFPKIKINCRI